MVLGFFETQWDAKDGIPDLTGKVALVTGGNTGIGYETCLHLASHGAHVYLAARTESRALAAIEKMKSAHPDAKVEWVKMDLMDLKSVRDAAVDFKQRETRLDMLVNNAGIMACPYELSKDGVEVQFQTNHLGHYLLTNLLLPTLKHTSKLPNTSVRVVNVSSLAHTSAPSGAKFETLEQVNQQYGSTWLRYGQSKLANVLFTTALATRLQNDKIFVNALHPGVINTELGRGPAATYGSIVNFFYATIGRLTLLTPYKGALTTLYCAASPEIEEKGYRGKYFSPIAKLTVPSKAAQDETSAENLWKLSEKVLREKGLLDA